MISVAEIAELVQGEVLGDPATRVASFAPLEEAGPGDVTFARGEVHRAAAVRSAAAVVISDRPIAGCSAVVVVVDQPDVAFSRIVRQLSRSRRLGAEPGIHSLASVHPSAEVDPGASVQAGAVVEAGAVVGPGTILFPGVYVGPGSRVGADCLLYPGAVLMDGVQVGDRVVINSGTVIGADGFGYATTAEGIHEKIPQVGTVVIEDDVEIGANSCIDRARFRETRIGRGTKIDNQVQIAHNVLVGPHCLIAAHVGIAGSVKLGHHVVLGGHVGVAGHLEIGDGAQVAAYSGIGSSIPGGRQYMGVPLQPIGRAQRIRVLQRRLPEIYERLRELEARVAELGAAGSPPQSGESGDSKP
jgi:UDP-3-O-[3-hydroxymyristoyl] glucosamine N-acyltransferase